MAEISNYSHEGWQVICITNGTWQQNCYLIKNDNSNECIIIDPGSEIDEIISEIKKIDSRPIAILNTHGHYDHIGAVSELKEEYKIKFYVHSKDKKLIPPALNRILLSVKFMNVFVSPLCLMYCVTTNSPSTTAFCVVNIF